MYDGKRVLLKIVYDAIEKIKNKSKDEPINVLMRGSIISNQQLDQEE